MTDVVRRHTYTHVAGSPLARGAAVDIDIDLTATAWQDDAACSGCDTEIFFSEHASEQAIAKRICGGCPVRDQCLQAAHDRREQFGVWGGIGPGTRRRQRAAARNAT